MPALVDAVRAGNLQRVKALVERGEDVNTTEQVGGETPLHAAASVGRMDIAHFLVDRGADVSAADIHGETPLHVAAAVGRMDIARLLVDRGADVTAADSRGETPLHRAVHYGNRVELAYLLLDRGARPDVANSEGVAPIDLAANPLEPSFPFTKRLPPDMRLLRRMIGESGALIVLATKMVGKAAKAEAEREKRRADAMAAAEGPCTRSRAKRRRVDAKP